MNQSTTGMSTTRGTPPPSRSGRGHPLAREKRKMAGNMLPVDAPLPIACSAKAATQSAQCADEASILGGEP